MQVRSLGERGIISMIHRMQSTPPAGFVGIGDDAAVLPGDASGWLVSQDMLVEDIHFRWDWSTPEQVGYKAAQVNLSDIAAMGGRPTVALTSLALPGSYSSEVVEAIYRGLTRAFDPYGVIIVGGDTVGAVDRLTLGVTILGQPTQQGPVFRSGAKPGDRLIVSGRLGASYAGYMLLSHGGHWPGDDINERSVLTAHFDPEARVNLGLGVAEWVDAMTDISDGLVAEVEEMIRFGAIGAEIWIEKLPIDSATRTVAHRFKSNGDDYALFGGEDYELLMAVAPAHLDQILKISDALGITTTVIGMVTDTPGIRWSKGGKNVVLTGERVAFDHFSR